MAGTMEQAFLNAGAKPVKPRKVRVPKGQKCRKCGADMRFVENTNILVCTGDIGITAEDGTVKSIPCTNKFIFTVAA